MKTLIILFLLCISTVAGTQDFYSIIEGGKRINNNDGSMYKESLSWIQGRLLVYEWCPKHREQFQEIYECTDKSGDEIQCIDIIYPERYTPKCKECLERTEAYKLDRKQRTYLVEDYMYDHIEFWDVYKIYEFYYTEMKYEPDEYNINVYARYDKCDLSKQTKCAENGIWIVASRKTKNKDEDSDDTYKEMYIKYLDTINQLPCYVKE